MVMTAPQPGAVAAPSAADPNQLAYQPVPGAQVPTPGAGGFGGYPPVVAQTPAPGAPDAAAIPQGQQPVPQPGAPTEPAPQPAAPPTPQAPPVTMEQYQQLQRQAQMGQQLAQEITRLGEEQQRQAQEQAAAREAEGRVNQAYALAERMEPAEAFTYLKNFSTQERARYEGEMNRIRQEAEQRTFNLLAQATAPLYAQELARQNGLPPEYAQRLAMLPPHQMDTYLPVLLQEYQQTQQSRNAFQAISQELDQLKRMFMANQAQSGAPTTGGSGMSPLAPVDPNNPQNLAEKGSRSHLLSIPGVARAFGLG